ncbi:MAG: hypothetical protein FIB01_09090 [Gemmatimonadetes bacterium]|nr:hypothetical protein [Gemmatimonadota bacterium]
MSAVVCGYCGRHFAEDQGQPACAGCPLRKGCRFVRCPHCGYENPATPPLWGRLRRLVGSVRADAPAVGITVEERSGS